MYTPPEIKRFNGNTAGGIRMKKMRSIVICLVLVISMLASCAGPDVPLTVAEMLNLGEKYLLEHDYEQALVQFMEIIEVEPMNPRGYTGAADAYMGLGRTGDATNVLRLGVTTISGNTDLIDLLAGAYIDSGDLNEAMALIESGLATAPNHPSLSKKHEELSKALHTHLWVDASCIEPKNCIDCGETEGSALGHDFTEANFHEAEICLICEAVGRDPLTPGWIDFNRDLGELYGVLGLHEIELGETYHYISWTLNNSYEPVETAGQLTILDYRVFESNDGYPAKEGYEYRLVKFQMIHSDRNAQRYGFYTSYDHLDYYLLDFQGDINNLDDGIDIFGFFQHWCPSSEYIESGVPGFYKGDYLLNYNGNEHEYFFAENEHFAWRGNNGTFTVELVFLVPIGYDGIIINFTETAGMYFRLR